MGEPEVNFEMMMCAARRAEKRYAALVSFLTSVELGERAVVHAPDYVIMSRNVYESMQTNTRPDMVIDDMPTCKDGEGE